MNSHDDTARSAECVGPGIDLSLVGSQPADGPDMRFETDAERRWEQTRAAPGSSASQLPGPGEMPFTDHHADLAAQASYEPPDVTVLDSDLELLGGHGTDLPAVSVIIPAYTHRPCRCWKRSSSSIIIRNFWLGLSANCPASERSPARAAQESPEPVIPVSPLRAGT
jgi:hypothetical protein